MLREHEIEPLADVLLDGFLILADGFHSGYIRGSHGGAECDPESEFAIALCSDSTCH